MPELKIIKGDDKQNSLKRIIAFFGFIVLSGSFGITAYKTGLTAEMLIAYPLGVVMLYVPQLAITLLKIWKGQGTQ